MTFKVFFDICDRKSEEYLGRITIQINEDMKLHPSVKNFILLILGTEGRSYKRIILDYHCYLMGGLVTPVFVPSEGESRRVDRWETKRGDVYQMYPDHKDARYSEFAITFNKLSIDSPKLGSVINLSDLDFLENVKSKNILLRVFDCGIIIE